MILRLIGILIVTRVFFIKARVRSSRDCNLVKKKIFYYSFAFS